MFLNNQQIKLKNDAKIHQHDGSSSIHEVAHNLRHVTQSEYRL